MATRRMRVARYIIGTEHGDLFVWQGEPFPWRTWRRSGWSFTGDFRR